MKNLRRFAGTILSAAVLIAGAGALAQTNRPIYTDNLVNDFSASSSGLTCNIASTNTVHTGSYSISAAITASGGYISFQHSGFNSSPYGSVQFWINGGTSGGQLLKIYGTLNGGPQTAYALPKLMTNVWQQFLVPLSSLGCSNKSNFSGLRIQDASGGAQPVFYVDDVYIGAAPAPAVVHLSISAAQTNRMADARWFGVNAATWDGYLGNSATLPALTNAGILNLRWPGGSGADTHNWATDISEEQTFNHIATNLGAGAQTFITVNYGSGDSNMAAGYVLFDNITNHCHYQYWEIGNECYGTWEEDTNIPAHNPYTYAVKAATYLAAMRAADPTIKIGVVAAPGDSSYQSGNTHGATNLRTGAVVYGWIPVVLGTLRSLGAQPDFLIHHVYP
ncbi:MAG: alpha-L-arabinofuranosidase, partial [Verrucomicrobiota bacterium]